MEHSSKSNSSNHFNTNFCLALTTQVLENEANKGTNFVASPLSLHVVLSLVAAGSTGRTLEQLLFFLGSQSVDELSLLSSHVTSLISPNEGSESPRSGPLLSFVNGAWLDQRYNLKPSFEAIVKETYKAEIKNVDFVAKADEIVDEVNSWAEKETEGLITKLLPYGCVDFHTVLVFANALYFKGSWDKQFDTSNTRTRNFHLLNGQTVQVPFMTTGDNPFERHLYKCFDTFKVLKIPYRSGQDSRRFSMYFFLPNERDGIFNLIQKVKSNPNFLDEQYELTKDKLTEFWIPKFKFSFEFGAIETMHKMGLKLPFKPGELTEVIDCPILGKDIFVSKVFHKSCIEVNEEGTEAATSTAVMFELQRQRVYPSFVADHPFLFMIREETHGIVFFFGAVLNPLLDS
ncbi:serpin-ZX-like [Humulus lupulus]|uniref:serpin-ZX-like n=1 Tax=Humulus lupulus TaxID=3486 RepID=UPI002B413401|nr:serpin-ZX-like [Humulus lupulus]